MSELFIPEWCFKGELCECQHCWAENFKCPFDGRIR